MRVFRNRIRKARLVHLLTQRELGELVGVSKNSISSFERCEYFPSLPVAFKLCEVLDCDFYWLFYFEEVSGDG